MLGPLMSPGLVVNVDLDLCVVGGVEDELIDDETPVGGETVLCTF